MPNQIDVNMIIDESGKYSVPSYIYNRCISRYLNFTIRPHRQDNAIFIDNDAISNLRLADESEQRGNIGLRSDNTSGIRGVYFDKARNKWMARLTEKGVMKNLGRFDTKEEAKAAYEKAAIVYFREFYNGDPHYASKLMSIINRQA